MREAESVWLGPLEFVRSSNSMSRSLAFLLLAASLSFSCAGATLRPLAYPDSETPCPAGRVNWKLEIADQRADRRDSERVTGLLRDSLTRSFPGCRWQPGSENGAPKVLIELHRFGVVRDGNYWEAAAEWSVVASDTDGRILTEFQAASEVSRPNYRGANNELEAMKQALDQAFRRTLEGLKAVSPPG